MTDYYGVVGNRDDIKLQGQRLPFWHFLDRHPAGWLCSLAYKRDDVPTDRPRIWDCGAWSYKALDTPHLGRAEVTPAWALAQYGRLARAGDTVIAPDHMVIMGVDLDARRRFNRESAAAFLVLCQGTGLVPMAVAHGTTLDERLATAAELIEMGYEALALGGLAGRTAQRASVIGVVTTVREAFPDIRLHVLGVSAPSFAAVWAAYGVDSFDGASHFKQAFTAGKFFVADGPQLRGFQAARPGEAITAPKCDCRACALLESDDVDTRRYGSNETNMGRAAHNLNQLMQALDVAMLA
jgi:hypothetical protein